MEGLLGLCGGHEGVGGAEGMKDWKTTLSALFTAFFGFVLLHPEYFPSIVVDAAGYAALGGFVAFGIAAKDHHPSLLDRPWNRPEK